MDGVCKEWKKAISHFDNNDELSMNDVTIKLFEVTNTDARWFNLRHCSNPISFISPGKYVKLIIAGELVMSDTPYEMNTNQKFVDKAHGNVLIGGLGIGLLTKNLIPKIENGEIKHISIWEKNINLINLWKMAEQYLPVHDKISVFNYDVFDYQKARSQLKGVFDSVYIDIWAGLDENAYTQMKHFRRAFRPFLNPNNPNTFIECWGREECMKKVRKGLF